MIDERTKNVRKVAKLLAVDDGDVLQLLDDGRLAGVLVDALNSKGIRATPSRKSSVEKLVKQMQRREAEQLESLSGPSAARGDLLTGEMTVTIMFTDIVGSTELQERLGDREARDLMRKHDDVIRSQTRDHSGIEVKATGDGFMLTFPSASRAVSAAIAMQRDLNTAEFLRPDGAIAIKLGLSVGEPIREEQDLFGMSVVLASRIGAKANPGQILASQIVYALLGSTRGFDFVPAGEHKLKGGSGRQMLYEVNWRGSDGLQRYTRERARQRFREDLRESARFTGPRKIATTRRWSKEVGVRASRIVGYPGRDAERAGTMRAVPGLFSRPANAGCRTGRGENGTTRRDASS